MSEFRILSDNLISPPEPRRAAVQISSETSAEYFERRGQQELAYAAELSDPRCQAIHIDLASRYAQLAAVLRQTRESGH